MLSILGHMAFFKGSIYPRIDVGNSITWPYGLDKICMDTAFFYKAAFILGLL
jgi:hypothetical protein